MYRFFHFSFFFLGIFRFVCFFRIFLGILYMNLISFFRLSLVFLACSFCFISHYLPVFFFLRTFFISPSLLYFLDSTHARSTPISSPSSWLTGRNRPRGRGCSRTPAPPSPQPLSSRPLESPVLRSRISFCLFIVRFRGSVSFFVCVCIFAVISFQYFTEQK